MQQLTLNLLINSSQFQFKNTFIFIKNTKHINYFNPLQKQDLTMAVYL